MAESDNKLFNALGVFVPEVKTFGFEQDIEEQTISTPGNTKSRQTDFDENSDSSDEHYLQLLINRIVKQDQSAFSALFKAMSVRVSCLALRITGSSQLSEEIAEDTFFQVWRQAPRFDPSRGTVKAWILTIARSRALDALRSVPKFEELAETETNIQRERESQNHSDPPDLLSTVEQNQFLYKALESLDSVPRQLIALSYFRGYSHEEIAEQVGIPLGTVKSHIRRAMIHLRETLLTS